MILLGFVFVLLLFTGLYVSRLVRNPWVPIFGEKVRVIAPVVRIRPDSSLFRQSRPLGRRWHRAHPGMVPGEGRDLPRYLLPLPSKWPAHRIGWDWICRRFGLVNPPTSQEIWRFRDGHE